MLKKKKSKLSKLSKVDTPTTPSKPTISNMGSARAYHNLPTGATVSMIFQADERGEILDAHKPLVVFIDDAFTAEQVHADEYKELRPTILIECKKLLSKQDGVYSTDVLLEPINRHIRL